MVACTPNCLLPYQEGSDAPCDLSDVWCDFAAKIDANLVSLASVAARTVNVPMAVVSMSSPLTLGLYEWTDLPFDQVLVDVGDMVNLDVSQFGVFARIPDALYTYSMHVEAETTDVATELRCRAYVGPFRTLEGFSEGASTLSPYEMAIYMNHLYRPAGYPLHFAVEAIGGAGVVTVNSAILSVAWAVDE